MRGLLLPQTAVVSPSDVCCVEPAYCPDLGLHAVSLESRVVVAPMRAGLGDAHTDNARAPMVLLEDAKYDGVVAGCGAPCACCCSRCRGPTTGIGSGDAGLLHWSSAPSTEIQPDTATTHCFVLSMVVAHLLYFCCTGQWEPWHAHPMHWLALRACVSILLLHVTCGMIFIVWFGLVWIVCWPSCDRDEFVPIATGFEQAVGTVRAAGVQWCAVAEAPLLMVRTQSKRVFCRLLASPMLCSFNVRVHLMLSGAHVVRRARHSLHQVATIHPPFPPRFFGSVDIGETGTQCLFRVLN